MRRYSARFSALFAALLGACSTSSAPEPPARADAPTELEPVGLAGVERVSRAGDVWLASQPSREALAELKERGVTLVVDLRAESEERGYDERAAAAELGMRYANPGFRSADALTDAVFDEARMLLREADGGVLVHCSSGNRVGAVWLAARVLDQGVPWATAVEEARRAGLRSPELEQRARAYVLGPASPASPRWVELKSEIRAKFPNVDQMSVDELAARLESGADAPLLLDVRAVEEHAVSHLAGARRAETKTDALALLADAPRDREIVLYCSVGYRSSSLASELAQAGFTNVHNLEGSIFEWANTGHVVVRDGTPARAVHPYDADWGKLLERELWSEIDER